MEKKKKIIVIPFAGLGNRMRVIASCVQIAKRDNRTLWMVWPKNAALGSDITDIFESIGVDYYVPPRWVHNILTFVYRHGAIIKYPKIYKLLSKAFFTSTIFDNDMNYKNQPKMEIKSDDKTILVANCFAFGEKQNYELFKFTEDIRTAFEREYMKISKPYIGVHIRRTDHVNLIKLSPLENYLNQINKCIQTNNKQKFYLATDDEKIRKYITELYGKRFYSSNHLLERVSKEGVYGAVIELLVLSKSYKIICSKISSYSDTAILIGDIKEVINV